MGLQLKEEPLTQAEARDQPVLRLYASAVLDIFTKLLPQRHEQYAAAAACGAVYIYIKNKDDVSAFGVSWPPRKQPSDAELTRPYRDRASAAAIAFVESGLEEADDEVLKLLGKGEIFKVKVNHSDLIFAFAVDIDDSELLHAAFCQFLLRLGFGAQDVAPFVEGNPYWASFQSQ